MKHLILSLACLACSLPSTPAPAANQPTQITTSAKELIAAYDANEVSADQTYKGKIVEVSGSVASINKDLLDEPFVTLAGKSSEFREVQCSLPKPKPRRSRKIRKLC